MSAPPAPAVQGSAHETLTIPVCHWEHLSRSSIVLSKLSSYPLFEAQVGELFSDEIGSKDFRLYNLPFESDELDEKLRLSSENFTQFIEDKFSGKRPRRMLYVSNTGSTPTKLPMLLRATSKLSGNKRESIAGDNSSTVSHNSSGNKRESSAGDSKSNSSTDSNKALCCKRRDKFTCRLCDYYTNCEEAQTKQLEAAHIYELEELAAIPEEERQQILEAMEIYDINNPLNLITLCQVCHKFFDEQRIGINTESNNWIITSFIENKIGQTKRPYKDFHGKTAGFAMIPKRVLAHRYNRFTTAKEVVSIESCGATDGKPLET